jgi:hypothetical protein
VPGGVPLPDAQRAHLHLLPARVDEEHLVLLRQ